MQMRLRSMILTRFITTTLLADLFQSSSAARPKDDRRDLRVSVSSNHLHVSSSLAELQTKTTAIATTQASFERLGGLMSTNLSASGPRDAVSESDNEFLSGVLHPVRKNPQQDSRSQSDVDR